MTVKSKKHIFAMIGLICSAVLFVVTVVDGLLFSREFRIINQIIFAVPLVLFIVLFILLKKKKVKRIGKTVLYLFVIIVSMVTLIFNSMYVLFDESAITVTDVSKYSTVLRIYGYPKNEGIRHFPKKIPADISDLHFFETPQFLQGGSSVLLYYKDNKDVSAAEKEFEKKAVYIYKPSEGQIIQSKLPSVSELDLAFESLPKDFRVYYFGSEQSADETWNHGRIYGAAVSTARNSILYFLEQW